MKKFQNPLQTNYINILLIEKKCKDYKNNPIKLNTFKVYSSSSFCKRVIKAFQKIRKIEKKRNMKSNLKIVKVYKMIENREYKELRLLAISKPKEFLKGIYLYTICED